jgi:hypothetical protein
MRTRSPRPSAAPSRIWGPKAIRVRRRRSRSCGRQAAAPSAAGENPGTSAPFLPLDDADMGGHDPPPLGEPHPALHLAADLAWRPVAAEQRRGDREVGAEGRDDGPLQLARKAGGGARRAKRLDRLMAVEIFCRAVADGLRRIQEKAIERFDVVGDQRPFVRVELRFELGYDGGIIDDQVTPPWARNAQRGAGTARSTGRSPGRPSAERRDRRADHALFLQGVSDA